MTDSRVLLFVFESGSDHADDLRRAVGNCPYVKVFDSDAPEAISSHADAKLLSPMEAEDLGSRPSVTSWVVRSPTKLHDKRMPPFVVVARTFFDGESEVEMARGTIIAAIDAVNSFNRSQGQQIWKLALRSSMLGVERIGRDKLGSMIREIACGGPHGR